MFKKILFVLVILTVAISVSACSRKNNLPVQATATNSAINLTAKKPNLINNSVATSATVPINNLVSDSNQLATITATSVKNITTMPVPEKQVNLTKQYLQALVKTNFGDITLKFYAKDAPLTVNNFLNLAKAGFYNNTKFHRIIKGFMIQGGDPLTKGTDILRYGTGGPGYQFKNEINNHKLVAGSIAMANAGPNTNGSQFFIVTGATEPGLDGSYTNFGEVVSGMDTVRKIENVPVRANPSNPSEISFPTKEVVINSIELLK